MSLKLLSSPRFFYALLLLCCSHSTALFSKEIALSFDDAPRAGSGYFDGMARTKALVDSLKEAEVSQVMFFAVGKRLEDDPEGQVRLNYYVNAGHLLANHSYSHGFIHHMGIEAYIEDVRQGHELLSTFDGYRPYFRFPYLNEGRTIEHRDALRKALKSNGLTNGYVTVDNYDWWLEALFQRAIKQGKVTSESDLKAWRAFYVETLMDAIKFYDAMSVKHLGRSVKHMLLLHENDLAALFIDDLIQAIREEGFDIISPEEAYRDPIASDVPDTLFNGQGRVAALARVKGIPARELVHPLESEQALTEEAIKRGLLQPEN